jgi:hypothetical protein
MTEGQNNPTQRLKRQKLTRLKHPPCEMLWPFSTTGSTRTAAHIKISGTTQQNYHVTWRYTYRRWAIRHRTHGGSKTKLKNSFWKVWKLLIWVSKDETYSDKDRKAEGSCRYKEGNLHVALHLEVGTCHETRCQRAVITWANHWLREHCVIWLLPKTLRNQVEKTVIEIHTTRTHSMRIL